VPPRPRAPAPSRSTDCALPVPYEPSPFPFQPHQGVPRHPSRHDLPSRVSRPTGPGTSSCLSSRIPREPPARERDRRGRRSAPPRRRCGRGTAAPCSPRLPRRRARRARSHGETRGSCAVRGLAVAANFFRSTSRSRSGSARTKMAPGSPSGISPRSRSWRRRSCSSVSWSIVNCTRYRSGASGAIAGRWAAGARIAAIGAGGYSSEGEMAVFRRSSFGTTGAGATGMAAFGAGSLQMDGATSG